MTPRARIWWLSMLVLGLGAGLVVLAQRAPERSDEPTGADPLDSRSAKRDSVDLSNLVADLERELLSHPRDSLDSAWHLARGLGPRTPPEIRRELTRARDESAPLDRSRVPTWAGADVKLALSTTLLESGGEPDDVAPSTGTEGDALTHSFTLAWQLERAALLRRGNVDAVPPLDLARLAELGLGHLERHEDADPLASAFLAAALFRAAPGARDDAITQRTKRAFARLLVQSRSRPTGLPAAAARVEALSAFLLWQRAEGVAIDLRTSNTLRELQSALALVARGPRDMAGTSAALRALRLSRAVLGDTGGVFRQ